MTLAAGELVLLPRGHALVLGSSLDAPAIDFESFVAATADGEIAVINGGGSFCGLGGYFELMPGPAASLLLGSLPPVVHLAAGAGSAGLRWLAERLMAELRVPRPGGRLVAGHLSETLLIEALRLYMAATPQAGVGWLAALADPRLSEALAAIHADPARDWTLAALARIAGMSRSSFAARFAAVAGEPAISYPAAVADASRRRPARPRRAGGRRRALARLRVRERLRCRVPARDRHVARRHARAARIA